jgi:hypothetical protein
VPLLVNHAFAPFLFAKFMTKIENVGSTLKMNINVIAPGSLGFQDIYMLLND